MVDFTKEELMTRLKKLQNILNENGISLAVLTQNTDIYYYTGSSQPLYLLVPDVGEPLALVRKAFERTRFEVEHIEVGYFTDTKSLTSYIERFNIASSGKIGFTLDVTSYSTVTRWQKLFNGAEIADLSWQIRLLRMVKSPAEIDIQRKAGSILKFIPELLFSEFKPGMTELQLSAVIENFLRINGHGILIKCRKEGIDGLGVCSAGINSLAGTKFDGICAGTGLSSAVPFGASNEIIPENTLVILDFGFNYRGYLVDITRMFTWGRPSDMVLEAYQAMVEIEKSVIKELAPGKEWSAIYDFAFQLADNYGYAEQFMGLGTEKVRFIGHGVGLELDEPPFLAPKMSEKLSEGMVLAIEPKVSLPGIGVVGIEDTVVLQNSGCEYLTICSDEFIIV